MVDKTDKIDEVKDLIKQRTEEIERLLTELEEEYLGRQPGMVGYIVLPENLDNEFIPDRVNLLNFD